jgi:peptide/nickel transport system permease protein
VSGFLLRRSVISLVTLALISAILFSILTLAPGDPFAELALNPDIPPQVRLNLRKQLGIDDPVPVQYLRWVENTARGNWGYSYQSRVNVFTLIMQRLPTTLAVIGLAYLLSVLIAIPIGIIGAVRQYSWLDNLFTLFAYVGYCSPTFFTGLVFILIFSIQLGWLPFIYTTDFQASGLAYLGDLFKVAIMPILVLAFFQAAGLARYTRAAMLDVIRQDYVRTAQSKGLAQMTVVMRHAFRNALIPVVTIMALDIPGIVLGAIITEQIFRIPGMGSLLINSIEAKDTPVVMAITFTYAILVVVFNLLADIMYGALDPRIKFA